MVLGMEKSGTRDRAKKFVITYLLILICIQVIGILLIVLSKNPILFLVGAIFLGTILPIMLGLIMLRFYRVE